jgi:hypothetical protein
MNRFKKILKKISYWLFPPIIVGMEDGNMCNRNGCTGIIELSKPENCSCHLGGAPCSACMSTYFYCPKCGWEEDHEYRRY